MSNLDRVRLNDSERHMLRLLARCPAVVGPATFTRDGEHWIVAATTLAGLTRRGLAAHADARMAEITEAGRRWLDEEVQRAR